MPYFGIPIRNGLPIGLGSVAGFGIAPFSPESLFENGEVGAWYDPSDYSTLFTDSAGTTPVTGVEQFVGLMLDKSGRGNHAFQTSSAKRPKLAARYNLLTYSEEFDNATAWTPTRLNTTGTPAWVNVEVAPDGTTTAEKLIEDTTASSNHYVVSSNVTVTAGTVIVGSVYVKPAERSWIALQLGNVAASYAWINTADGTIGTQALSPLSVTATNVGNGWYRCTISKAAASTGTTNLTVFLSTGNNVLNYSGDGTSGLFVWGADLRPASQATGLIGPTYQRVAAATVYDTAGFLPYLAFNGLDDSMSTNSIDFSAGGKMTVWAGVRKLSDASQFPVIVELSNGLNAGAFSLYSNGNNANLDGYSASIRGSSGDGYYYIKTYASPITSVWSNEFDIAGAVLADENKPRINATIPPLVVGGAGPAGTGNFGNYPLYIGMRNNASLPFNGWLTSLIVRGAQSTQSQIEATEAWVNGKTGAY